MITTRICRARLGWATAVAVAVLAAPQAQAQVWPPMDKARPTPAPAPAERPPKPASAPASAARVERPVTPAPSAAPAAPVERPATPGQMAAPARPPADPPPPAPRLPAPRKRASARGPQVRETRSGNPIVAGAMAMSRTLVAAYFDKHPGRLATRVALLDFENGSPAAEQNKLGLVVREVMAGQLSRSQGILLVERGRIQEIIGELRLQNSPASDPGSAKEIGRLLGAEMVVMGTVSDAGSDSLLFSRAVAVETGEVLATAQAEAPRADLLDLSSRALVERSRTLAITAGMVCPGMGHIYSEQYLRGAAYLTAFTGLLVGLAVEYRAFKDERDRYKQDRPDTVDAYDAAERHRKNANGLAAGAAAVWGINVLDIALTATDTERVDASEIGSDAGNDGAEDSDDSDSSRDGLARNWWRWWW